MSLRVKQLVRRVKKATGSYGLGGILAKGGHMRTDMAKRMKRMRNSEFTKGRIRRGVSWMEPKR